VTGCSPAGAEGWYNGVYHHFCKGGCFPPVTKRQEGPSPKMGMYSGDSGVERRDWGDTSPRHPAPLWRNCPIRACIVRVWRPGDHHRAVGRGARF